MVKISPSRTGWERAGLLKRPAQWLLLASIFLLAACSTVQSTTVPSSSLAQPGNGAGQGSAGSTPLNLTLENKLALGTLKLEGTNLAVTAQQAQQLLPLWQKVASQMSARDTAAADYQADYQQIEAAMTSDQLQTITNMSFTGADLRNEMQALGIQGGFPGGLTADQRATRVAQAETQNPGAFVNGTPGAPRFQGTPDPQRTPGAGGFGGRNTNQIFLQTLIKLLQTRAGS